MCIRDSNVFVIFLVVRFRRLQNITFYIALQIIIVDLANTVIIYPSSAANAIANGFVFTGLCSAMGFLISFLRIARNGLMFVMVADRFCLIFLPFWYSRHRVKVMLPISIGTWILSLILTLIPVSGLLDCYGFQRFTWSCLLGVGCKHVVECTAYRTFLITSSNVGTFIALLLYLALLCKARKLRNKITLLQSNESSEDKAAAKEKHKRERRANTTFLILFAALVGVSFPSYLFFTFGNIALNALNVRPAPPAYTIVAILSRSLFPLLVIMDPIVIMRNQDVREVIHSIFGKLSKRGVRAPSRVITNTTDQTEESVA